MTSVERNLSGTEQEVTEWAPIVTCASEMSLSFEAFNVDYDLIGNLLEERGFPREELRNLRIHFAVEPFSYKLDHSPSLGIFMSNARINGPMGERYKSYIQEELPDIDPTELQEKSFIFIDVPHTLIMAREHGSDEVRELRATMQHELLHFAEYLENGSEKMMKLFENPAYNKYEIIDLAKQEEMIVRIREVAFLESVRYKTSLTGVLRKEPAGA